MALQPVDRVEEARAPLEPFAARPGCVSLRAVSLLSSSLEEIA
jgi:hypothetical protein